MIKLIFSVIIFQICMYLCFIAGFLESDIRPGEPRALIYVLLFIALLFLIVGIISKD